MSNSKKNNAFNNYKVEVAKELGVDLNDPNLTAKEAGSVGGEMVKRMIDSYKQIEKSSLK